MGAAQLAGCHPSGPPCQLSRDAFREQLEKDKFKRHNNDNQIQNTDSHPTAKALTGTAGAGATTRGGPNRTTHGGGPMRTTFGDDSTISGSTTRTGTTPTRQSSYTKYTRTKTKGSSTSTKIKTTTTERGSYTETVTNYTKLKRASPYFPIGSITSSIMSPFTSPVGGPLCPGSTPFTGYTKGGGYSATAMIQASWRRQRHTKQEQTVKVKQYAPRRDVRPAMPMEMETPRGTPGGAAHGHTPGMDTKGDQEVRLAASLFLRNIHSLYAVDCSPWNV